MDLKQLRYFARIVELESITAAAESLHIAQPSLSQHMTNLEGELDAKLLVRGRFGARPTETGRVLYRHAKSVLRQIEEAKAAVRHGNDVPGGRVSVGLPTSTSRVLALPLLRRAAQRYPQVTLELLEASNADLAEFVALQRIDLAVAMDVTPQASMHTLPILDETLMLVGPAEGVNGSAVSLARIASLPLILPSFPNSVRVIMDRALINANLSIRLVAETSALSILLSSVREGLGWTVLPWSALAGLETSSQIFSHPIADVELKRRMSLCTSTSARQSLACNAIESLMIEVIADLIRGGEWKGVELLPSAALPATASGESEDYA